MDVTIAKTIERSKPMEGRKILAVRKNSKGRDVFIIEATDEEILDKERAVASKALRTCLLRLVPGDILEEAVEQCYATRRGEIAKDPSAARKKMVDAFDGLGVNAKHIVEYLGHAIDDTSVAEINTLRSLYQAIKDGETTWALAMEQRRAQAAAGADATSSAQAADLNERLAQKAAATKPSGDAAPASKAKAASAPKQGTMVDAETGEIHD